MQKYMSEITKIQRKVYVEVAKLAFSGKLVDEVDALPKKLTDEAGLTNYRCCKYKERAILSERIRLAMGFAPMGDTEDRLSTLAGEAMEGAVTVKRPGDAGGNTPVIQLIDIACDKCPIEKIVVTDSCRNCVGHYCRNSCPKDAIYIIQDRAFVDKSKCVECGRCAKACPFGAILQLERPCERSCAVGAISPGDSHNAVIDGEKCVGCAACTTGCPFGAIAPTSQLLKAIKFIMAEGITVVAMLAPSFAGQFGPTVGPEKVKSGLLALGFDAVVEVAAGAEKVAEMEAHELLERSARGDGVMTTSCCPAFTTLVRTHHPELAEAVSHTPSPMKEGARMVKDDPGQYGIRDDQPIAAVFIGPCHAKKGEAADSLVDAVLTFEELACMFVAKDVNLATLDNGTAMRDAGRLGRFFARSGGPGEAVMESVKAVDPEARVESIKASGLKECQACLKEAKDLLRNPGVSGLRLIEGMACEGGCIGGPAVLANPLVAERALSRMVTDTPGQDR